jgi:hypothetical protein
MAKMSRLLLCSVFIALLQPFQALAQRDGQHDFDFEFGAWKTRLSRLDRPLTGSRRWLDYEGTSVVRKVGMAAQTSANSTSTVRAAASKG